MKKIKIALLIVISFISLSSFSQSLTNKSSEELEIMKKEAISSENFQLAKKISEEQKSRVSLDDVLIELNNNLKIAVANENFDEAAKIKKEIKKVEEKIVTLKKLEEEKKAAIATEDFDKVIALEKQIKDLKIDRKPEPTPTELPANTTTNTSTTNSSDNTTTTKISKNGISGQIINNDNEKIRQAWKTKGGSLRSTTLDLGYSYLSLTNETMEMTGSGYSGAFSISKFKLNMPDYETGKKNWSSFIYGIGFSYSHMSTEVSSSYTTSSYDYYTNSYTQETIYTNSSSSSGNITIPANIGVVIGMGKFKEANNWKGTIVSLNYKPSYIIPLAEGAESSFNYLGFSINFSGANFDAFLDKIAPKPKTTFSIFILPAMDDKPFFLNLTLGLQFYK